jgi:hypothetical protein
MMERGAVLAPRRAPPRRRWPWSSCRTGERRRAMSPGRRTSTRSRATTGRATTRWR